MAATTYTDFGSATEAIQVAQAFASEIHGKTILITGVNRGGLGYATAQAIASQSPARVIITGRNKAKIQESIDALNSEYPGTDFRILQADLSSQKSVRAAADEVLAWSDVSTIDVIICNAGIMGIQERTLSAEGIELHMATNHIGHFILTNLLSKAKHTTRVVNVTSLSPTRSAMRWSDPNFEKKNKDLPESERPNYDVLKFWGYKDIAEGTYFPLEGYNQSKVANVLFTIGLNKRAAPKLTSVSVHPGIIMTELGRDFAPETAKAVADMMESGQFPLKTMGAGAATTVVAAFDPKLAVGTGETKNGSENWGSYLIDCQISDQAHPLAVSSSEAEKLWAFSEKFVGQEFSW